MTSHAAKRRARKASRKLAPVPPRKRATTVDATVRIEPVQAPKPRGKTGIEWMRGKKRLTVTQARAGERYGRDHRLAGVDGLVPLRSALASVGMTVDGGVPAAAVPVAAYESEARGALYRARAALSWQADLIRAVDLVCGRELTPSEAAATMGGGQRIVVEIESALKIALDLLATHYDNELCARRQRASA